MEVLSHYPVRYFHSFILVILLSEVAICVDIDNVMNQTQKSQLFVENTTKSSTDTPATSIKTTTQLGIELTTKALTSSSLVDDLENKTGKPLVSHDNFPNRSGLPQHSTDTTTVYKPAFPVLNSSSTSTSTASIGTSTTLHNLSTSIVPTVPVHRKSKPEETHIDDVQDSGPTTDYVVPLVVAMLAVPLVGVLCALLYMKGRDFWERRHYGRIDFLWDSRNDSRMDFLIDGMYRE